MELTVLGHTVRHPIEHVEVFPAPPHLASVTFRNDELSSMCPVTEQPDLSDGDDRYEPGEWCVESKSLKLYLWRFRDRAVFAEALASEIAQEIMYSAKPARGECDAHTAPAWRDRGGGSRRARANPVIPGGVTAGYQVVSP